MTAWLAVTMKPSSGSSTLGSPSKGMYSPVQSLALTQPSTGMVPSLPARRIGIRPGDW